MKYSKTISYINKKGKQITYKRYYENGKPISKKGKHIKIVKNKRTGKSYAYREYTVKGKKVRRRIKNIMKDGKITKYGEEYIKEYMKDLSISDRNDLEDKLNEWKRKGTTVTVEKLKSHLSETKIERFIYNMGGEMDELAADLGVKEEELLDMQKWDDWDSNPTFTYEGVTYEFTFDYDTHSLTWKVKE